MALIKLHTQETYYDCLFSHEWEELVIKTEGYSGSDISTVIADGLLEPVRELEMARHWKPSSSELSTNYKINNLSENVKLNTPMRSHYIHII